MADVNINWTLVTSPKYMLFALALFALAHFSNLYPAVHFILM